MICAAFLFGIGLGTKYLALGYLLPMAVWALKDPLILYVKNIL